MAEREPDAAGGAGSDPGGGPDGGAGDPAGPGGATGSAAELPGRGAGLTSRAGSSATVVASAGADADAGAGAAVDAVVEQRAARRARIAAAHREAGGGSPRALDALLREAAELAAWERATALRLDRPARRRSVLALRAAGAVVCVLTLLQIALAAAGLTELWRIGPAGLLLAGGLYEVLAAGRVGSGARHLWRRGGALGLLVAALAAGVWAWVDGSAPALVAVVLGAVGALGYLAGLFGEWFVGRRDSGAEPPDSAEPVRLPAAAASGAAGTPASPSSAAASKEADA
ncbi:hypothetical protein [Phaeacidiphilus oryzae]|uniref:hypothetical protein n=1 Tax=Phaeacidiphilus oryzae TaxID=348818 RepID=UPI0013771AAD|nr:hypothetical protein [Phaeacidiphilus oryzae]